MAARAAPSPFISAQNHWSLLEREAEAEVVPAAEHFGLGVLPYFPLANGLLTGKVRRGQAPPEGTRLATPGRATHRGRSSTASRRSTLGRGARPSALLEIASAALAAQPGCASVIAGATSPEQVKANAAAADWIPPQDALAGLDQIVPPPGPAS